MKYLFIALIKFYQKCLSPLKKPCCRFTPSCSSYALEAFRTRGFLPALLLSIGRILRCNPFCRGGYDPPPKHGLRRVKPPRSVIQCKIKRADAIDQEKWKTVCLQ